VGEVWLRTNERQDVAASIRHCHASLLLARTDRHAFKFVMLSLHSALQGACVCHLTTTFPPLDAATKENTAQWIKWSEEQRKNPAAKPPKTKLADLPELLKRIRKANSAGDGSNAVGISLSDSEYEWWKRIHDDIRNQFTHFAPQTWSIDVSGVPALIQLTVRLISNMKEVGWAFRHADAVWQTQFTSDLERLDSLASSFDFNQ
jgi:hypothetical protein